MEKKGSLTLDLSRFVDKTLARLNRVKRAVALELFTSIVYDTPVDTGRLRGNWQISIGSPLVGTIDRLDPNGEQVAREIAAMVGESKLEDVLILRNNLPYAHRIEYEGWSHTKAPHGMMRKNFVRIQQILKKAVQEGRL